MRNSNIKGKPKGNGISSVTSTSKIRKITPTRKNFMQNCIRVRPEGSNPHSNELDFSRSFVLLYVNVITWIRVTQKMKITEK